ncbi:MAG TPA: alpha/beta hydrolase [Chloroflexota bacterium]|jgi:pimeloyl-ACP methyl ester carboxylesterase
MRWQELSGPGRGIQLHVRRVIDPPGVPILLLHGLGVGGAVWQAFARRLSPPLAAVAPDLRGHGQSDAPPTGYTPADYAADLAELISELLEPPAPVVGHSLGALAGLALAEMRPELVDWMVLLDPPLDADLPNPEVAEVYRLRHTRAGELQAYLLGRNPGGGQVLAQLLAALFRQASDAAFEALLDPIDRVGRAPSAAQAAFDQAGRIRARTLVLQADPRHGGVLGDAAANAFVARLPHGQLIKIQGATHALHASQPAAVADAILSFGGYTSSVGSGSR